MMGKLNRVREGEDESSTKEAIVSIEPASEIKRVVRFEFRGKCWAGNCKCLTTDDLVEYVVD